jgi:hypothetical protein
MVTAGDSVELDYRITPVPSDNQGMGNGSYVTSFDLVEYGDANFNLDAEVYQVIRPSEPDIYSRLNPICNEPVIEIRNAGKTTITKLEIEYGPKGGKKATYNWTGSLEFMEKEEVTLPVNDILFWDNPDELVFVATVKNPNGQADENTENDTYNSSFKLPDTYDEPVVIQVRTNALPDYNSYTVKDVYGNVIVSRDNMSANTLYYDTIYQTHGCYTFEFLDEGYGLSYWAIPSHGNGFVRFRRSNGSLLKDFDPDFGEKIFYTFTMGFPLNVENPGFIHELDVYPNPAIDQATISIDGLIGNYQLQMTDLTGKVIYSEMKLWMRALQSSVRYFKIEPKEFISSGCLMVKTH